MTAAGKDVSINTRNGPGKRQNFQVVSAGTIYQGALVGIANQTTGALAATDTASQWFKGVCQKQVVNATSGTSRVEVVYDLEAYLTSSNILVTSFGVQAEVVDYSTVDLAAGTSHHVQVGSIEEYGDSTHTWIWLRHGSGSIAS